MDCINWTVTHLPFLAQVGPTGARAFHEFLVRLQLRCTNDDHNHLKELLLKLVYTLAAER